MEDQRERMRISGLPVETLAQAVAKDSHAMDITMQAIIENPANEEYVVWQCHLLLLHGWDVHDLSAYTTLGQTEIAHQANHEDQAEGVTPHEHD